MCKAIKHTKELMNIYKKIEEDFKTYTEKLRYTDLYEQDILHKIEQGGYSASQGYKYSKMLEDNRHERRKIKIEVATLKQLKESFTNRNTNTLSRVYTDLVNKDKELIQLNENKVYNPRVLKEEVIQEQQSNFIKQPAIYIKTGESINIIRTDSDGLYYVERQDGIKSYIRKQDIKFITEDKNLSNENKILNSFI